MPFKHLTCLSTPEGGGQKGRLPPSEQNMQLVPMDKPPDIPDNEKGVCTVLLQKADGVGMGLTVSGGLDKGDRPKISNMRPSGIAAMSDCLQTGDYIASVNGIKTGKMKHAEIISLLKNVGQTVTLEVEYQLPPTNVATPTIAQKTIDITLTKEDNGFGFVLRGGHNQDNMKTRSLVVTHIRPGSAADKDGTIKTGDRLKCINGVHLYEASLDDAYEMIKAAQDTATFTMEYDVSVMDAVNNASGPLLVEVSKTPGSNLGLVLTISLRRKKRVICIEKILPASIADRCGALRVGDQLMSIDGVSLDANNTSVEDASKMLQSNSDHVRIEILPVSQLAIEAPKNLNFHSRFTPTITSAQSLSALNSYSRHPRSHRSLASSAHRGSSSTWQRRRMHRPKYAASAISLASVDFLSGNQVVHTETFDVCLLSADNNCPPGSTASQYFGIQLQGGIFATEVLTSPPTIAYIDNDSAAEKCGRIQVRDRLVSINGCPTENETLDEVKGMLSEAMENGQVYLEIEFDVAESVVPSSGTFHVKLPKKRDIDLGIVVGRTASATEPLIITDIKRGSVAHRTGTIQAGDKLLSIDGVRLDGNSSVEHAIALLRSAEDVVRLKIRKDEENSDDAETSGAITFTVELKRYGGPLGITISGTEDALDPIIISGLTPGGLAHRTGAIHEGDQILSINNIPLRTKPVSEAIILLQTAGECVTLKIRKQPFGEPPVQSNPIQQSSRTATLPRSSLVKEPITELSDHEDDITTFRHADTPYNTEVSGTTDPSFSDNNFSREAEVTDRVAPAGAPSVDSAVGSMERTVGSEGQKNLPANDKLLVQAHSTPNPPTQTDPAKPNDVPRRTDNLRAKFDRERSPQRYEVNRYSRKSDGDRLSKNYAWTAQNDVGFERKSNNVSNSAGLDWQNALRELQSVGQSTDIVKDLEESIMNTSQLDISDEVFRPRHQRVPSYPRANIHSRQPTQSFMTSPTVQLHKITLQKSSDAEDFGFSLSDGQLERGVYVHSTRSNGPADRAGIRPYDRLLQVNGIRTRDFDCCQAIPLIAQSGRRIVLVIARHPHNTGMSFPPHQMPLLAPPMSVPSTNVMRSGAFETL